MMEISKTLDLTGLNIIRRNIFRSPYIDFNLALNGILIYAKAKRVKQDLTGYEDDFLKGISWILGKAIQFAKQKSNDNTTSDNEFNDVRHILTSAIIVNLQEKYNEDDASNLKNIFKPLFEGQENVAKIIKLGQWLEKCGLILDGSNLEKSYSYWNNYHPRMLALVCYFFTGHVFGSAQGFYQLAKLQLASRIPFNANLELKQNTTFAGKIFLTKIAKEISFSDIAEIEACRAIKGVILHLEKAEKIIDNKSNVDCNFKFELYATLIDAYHMSRLDITHVEYYTNLVCRLKKIILIFESDQIQDLSEKCMDMIYEYLKINFNTMAQYAIEEKLEIEINGQKIRGIVLELLKNTISLLDGCEELSMCNSYAAKNTLNLTDSLHLLPENYAEWFAKNLWRIFNEDKHKIKMLCLRDDLLTKAEKIISTDSAASFADVCIDILNGTEDIKANAADDNNIQHEVALLSNKIFEKLLRNEKWYSSNADKFKYWSSNLLKLKQDEDKIFILKQLDKLIENIKKNNKNNFFTRYESCIDEAFIEEQIKNYNNYSINSSVFNVIYNLLVNLENTPDSPQKENHINEVVEFAIKLFKTVINDAPDVMNDAYKVNDIYSLVYQYTAWFILMAPDKDHSNKQKLFGFFLNCAAFEKNHIKVTDLDLCKIQIDNLASISRHIDESMYNYLLQQRELDCFVFLQQYVEYIFEYAKTKNLTNDYLGEHFDSALQTLQKQDFNLMAKKAGYVFKYNQLDYYLSLYQQKKLYLTPSEKSSLQQEKAVHLFKASYADIDYNLNKLFNKLDDLKIAADQKFSHYTSIICKALSEIFIYDASAMKELDHFDKEDEVLAGLESFKSKILKKHLSAFKILLEKLYSLNTNNLKNTSAFGERGEEIKAKLEAENQQISLLVNAINQIVDDPTKISDLNQDEELMQLPVFSDHINQAIKTSRFRVSEEARRNLALLRHSSIIFSQSESSQSAKDKEAAASSDTNNEVAEIKQPTVTKDN